VVCPLKFEQRLLWRAGLSRSSDVHCCGCGSDPVAAFLDDLEPAGRPVVLAGLAGALRPEILPGRAFIAERVVDTNDGHWTPTLGTAADADDSIPRVIVTSVERTLTASSDKRRLAERTSAAIVDMESVTFARIASHKNWPWMIVRGVSDGVDDRLPHDINQWVDTRGRTRLGHIAAALVRRPADLASARRLHRLGSRAMTNVARAIEALVVASASD
jgi:hypothetical protein